MKQYIIVSTYHAIWVFSACSEGRCCFHSPDKRATAPSTPAAARHGLPGFSGSVENYLFRLPGRVKEYALISKTPNNPDEWIYLINREEVPTSNEVRVESGYLLREENNSFWTVRKPA